MTGFLSKLFGKKDEVPAAGSSVELITEVMEGLLAAGDFDFTFEVNQPEDNKSQISIEVYGEDEELLRERDGQLLDAFQLFLTRVVQHQLRDEKISINVDNGGFREKANQELTELAEKLKNVALDKGKPVYFRALSPRDRKVIHQYLAEDGRVRSRSVGEGLYKKVKIYPINKNEGSEDQMSDQQ